MTSFADKVPLGRTGLAVSRLGVGASYGVSTQACRTAFDHGVNYFFWGSLRTRQMCMALRDIARTHRDELVVVLQCYARKPHQVRRSVENGLRSLRMDRVEVLLLGWYADMPTDATLAAVQALREQGKVRYVGLSSHDRSLFPRCMASGHFDVLHVRYNAAHRGAEREVFPHVPDRDPPGIVSFTNTRFGDLLKPQHMPAGIACPSATDCYRFSLSHPQVQVATCGPANDSQMDDALAVLNTGPMDEDELRHIRMIGDHVHDVRSFSAIVT